MNLRSEVRRVHERGMDVLASPALTCGGQATVSVLLAELKKCSRIRDLDRGRAVHAAAVEAMVDGNTYIANTLLSMYAKCGSLAEAKLVFQTMPKRTRVSWTTLVLGCADNGEAELAFDLFHQMAQEGFAPDSRSFVAALKACSALATKEAGKQAVGNLVKTTSLRKGMAIHSMAVAGPDLDLHVTSALVDMYAKCGSLDQARRVFDGLPRADVVSRNALIFGYVENGKSWQALELYDQMLRSSDSEQATALTFVGLLKACTDLAEQEQGTSKLVPLSGGMAVHCQAEAKGFCDDVRVANTLVDMYTKLGTMIKARRVFDERLKQHANVVSWNALILGYAVNGEGQVAVELFDQMSCAPTPATLIAGLKGCSQALLLEDGRRVHEQARSRGLDRNPLVATALVELYGRCGCMDEAQAVFESLRRRDVDVVAWTALMDGYSNHGDSERVFTLFDAMQDAGVKPDSAVLSCVLTACRHAGLVDRGREVFESMRSTYGVKPRVEHYGCMVDILGRANELEAAVDLARRAPEGGDTIIWTTVLDACRKWGNLEVGRLAFESLVAMNEKEAVAYVLMADLYDSKEGLAFENGNT